MKRTCLMVRPRRLVHHSPSQSADHRRIVCLFSPIFCVIFAEQSQTFQNDLEGVRGGGVEQEVHVINSIPLPLKGECCKDIQAAAWVKKLQKLR